MRPEPRFTRFVQPWLLAGALGATVLFGIGAGGVAPAQACGGLFCSSANPVNQAAERIIFSVDKAAGKVTAVVEILYEGPSSKFAWVLPVPGIPEVKVSTSALLDRLQATTNPTYAINRDFSDSCKGGVGAGGSSGSAPGSPVPASDNAGGPAVSVVAAGSVGPYDYTVIKVDPLLSDPGMAAIAWLKANQFDVDALGSEVLRAYLRDGLNLIAFKLSKNRSTGSIRPVMLTYDSSHPMIPIRPTAVAANNDMGILVFVLGQNRAVPTNYKTLELNEALIDWFMPNTTYNAVVTAAANEAQGQGFVTELAMPTAMTGAGSLLQEQAAIDKFRMNADQWMAPDLVSYLVELFATFGQGGFGGPFGARPSGGRVALDGVSDVLAHNLVLPPGVTADDVLASPRCYFSAFRTPDMFYCNGKPAPAQVIDLTTFDRKKFLTDVEALVIGPLEATAKLFTAQPYLTRLYTTLSPAEMTLDPEFDINVELGDVSNAHQVTLKYNAGCGDTSGPWQAKLGDLVVKGEGNTWPVTAAAMKMPYNLRVLQLGITGKGTVTANNSDTIATALGNPAKGDGGCAMALATTGGDRIGWAGMLLMGPLVALLRRRRRQRRA
jgi:hypothetical protein